MVLLESESPGEQKEQQFGVIPERRGLTTALLDAPLSSVLGRCSASGVLLIFDS